MADGVHGITPEDPSELRRIHGALQRQTDDSGLGSGRASRALSSVCGLYELFALDSSQLTVLALSDDELNLALRLQSRRPEDRLWRHSLGMKARRLDAGESASIAIATNRSLAFASDDEDALMIWSHLSQTPGWRTRDLLRRLVAENIVADREARDVYGILQSDDLHNLGGPAW